MSSTAGNIFKKFWHQLSTEELIIISGHRPPSRIRNSYLFFPGWQQPAAALETSLYFPGIGILEPVTSKVNVDNPMHMFKVDDQRLELQL
jgi:hypothetical protein